jgi:hypothetical protein
MSGDEHPDNSLLASVVIARAARAIMHVMSFMAYGVCIENII